MTLADLFRTSRTNQKSPPDARIFAVYKPPGITSHDVVAAVRRITGVQKVGHGGTLDPLSEGVLVIGVGREATKQLSQIVAGEKEYEATITLGAVSKTDDLEGPIVSRHVERKPSVDDILRELKKFSGKILQIPPQYSALKIRGRRAYSYARKGSAVSIPARYVTIKDTRLLRYDWPELGISVITGPGVYIRSLARDLGEALLTGGYLTKLIRIRVGGFARESAIPYHRLNDYFAKNPTQGAF